MHGEKEEQQNIAKARHLGTACEKACLGLEYRSMLVEELICW